ncbi:MAG: ATP-dependent zinc metalloprotease FtsH [Clostridia bacterium]|nr:ATP-dependent zinc metalloprotease FtsH [Clostridia bacterium]
MKNNLKIILFYLVLIGVIIFVVAQLFSATHADKLVYSDIVTYFESEQVASFVVDEDYLLTMKLKDQTQVSYQLKSLTIFRDDLGDLILEQKRAGIIESYDYEPETVYPWWVSMLPYLIIIVLFIALWFYVMNQAVGGKGGKMNSFGKARVKTPQPDQKNRVLFKDVAGADEEKAELEEVVEYLKDPHKFSKLGAKIPHGVLLVGPPGTGKTLLAKAVAGEAGVPFFSISGSDFVEMYVGVGASRVRDLFDQARKAPASIIFIDEIDAVGRQRGAGLGGGHDEREQTLNQLLVEMDGFGSHEGIIVIAATNRPDILDPALLRPGRFDRQVTIGYPDIRGREEILKVHARNKPMESTVDFRRVAQTTVGFTGAELANLLNEAALLAARNNKSLIGMDDIEEAFMKLILGPKKKNRVRNEHDNKLVAYHEAGHAVASFFCPHTDPVKMISIIPAGNTGGVTVSVPEQDTLGSSRGEMFEKILMTLGGRVAEQLIMDDISTGASNDIQQATKIARNMVTRYGMSKKLGTVLYGSEHSASEVFLGRDFSAGKNYSEKTAAIIDEEIRSLIEEAYTKCTEILTEHLDKLHFVAAFLLKHEIMDGDQFKAAMEGEPTMEELEELAEEKKRKSREDNEKKRAEDEERARREAEEAERLENERRAAQSANPEWWDNGSGDKK